MRRMIVRCVVSGIAFGGLVACATPADDGQALAQAEPAETVQQFLVAFQAETGWVLHYRPEDVEGHSMPEGEDLPPDADSTATAEWVNQRLAPLGMLLFRIGPLAAGFWTLRKIGDPS